MVQTALCSERGSWPLVGCVLADKLLFPYSCFSVNNSLISAKHVALLEVEISVTLSATMGMLMFPLFSVLG